MLATFYRVLPRAANRLPTSRARQLLK